MAITTSRQINPYARIGSTLTQIIDKVGEDQAAVPGLNAESVSLFTGNAADDYFYNQYQRNELTKIDTNGLAAVAVNQFDASITANRYAAFTIQDILDIPKTDNSSEFISSLNEIERVAHANNTSASDKRIILIMSIVGATLAQYWQDQKNLGVSSNWENYLNGIAYSSEWAMKGIKGALLFSQNSGSIESMIVSSTVFSIAELTGVLQ